jgi:hypothetical protein
LGWQFSSQLATGQLFSRFPLNPPADFVLATRASYKPIYQVLAEECEN